MAFMVVLESMTPAERVAFVLHDVFGYPFTEMAGSSAQPGRLSPARLLRPPAHPASAGRRPGLREQAGIVRDFKRAWGAQDIGPWSACSTPTRPSSPTAAAWPAPRRSRSKAPSR